MGTNQRTEASTTTSTTTGGTHSKVDLSFVRENLDFSGKDLSF